MLGSRAAAVLLSNAGGGLLVTQGAHGLVLGTLGAREMMARAGDDVTPTGGEEEQGQLTHDDGEQLQSAGGVPAAAAAFLSTGRIGVQTQKQRRTQRTRRAGAGKDVDERDKRLRQDFVLKTALAKAVKKLEEAKDNEAPSKNSLSAAQKTAELASTAEAKKLAEEYIALLQRGANKFSEEVETCAKEEEKARQALKNQGVEGGATREECEKAAAEAEKELNEYRKAIRAKEEKEKEVRRQIAEREMIKVKPHVEKQKGDKKAVVQTGPGAGEGTGGAVTPVNDDKKAVEQTGPGAGEGTGGAATPVNEDANHNAIEDTSREPQNQKSLLGKLREKLCGAGS